MAVNFGWAGEIRIIELFRVGAAAAYDCLQDLEELNHCCGCCETEREEYV
jgi:hypothetical protein